MIGLLSFGSYLLVTRGFASRCRDVMGLLPNSHWVFPGVFVTPRDICNPRGSCLLRCTWVTPQSTPKLLQLVSQMEIKGLQSGHLSSLFVMAKTPERSFSLCHSVLQFAIWQSQSIACSDRARGVNGEMSAGLGWIKPKSFGVVPGTFLSPSSMRL